MSETENTVPLAALSSKCGPMRKMTVKSASVLRPQRKSAGRRSETGQNGASALALEPSCPNMVLQDMIMSL